MELIILQIGRKSQIVVTTPASCSAGIGLDVIVFFPQFPICVVFHSGIY